MNADAKISELEAILGALEQALATPAFEPDAARKDWNSQRAEISRMKEQLEGVVFDIGAPGADREPGKVALRTRTVGIGTELAAVLGAAGRASDAQAILSALEKLASDDDREICRAGRAAIPSYVALLHAMWLKRHNRAGDAERVLQKLVRGAGEPVLQRQARWLLDVPRPIKSAPSLFTLNGVGFRLWGSRDRHPDGSYIATWGLVVLFIPVLPLRAYRVLQQQGNRWLFIGSVPLGRVARILRNVVLLSMLGGISAAIGSAWLDGADHRASQALAAAAKLEKGTSAAARAEAAASYERAIKDFAGKADGELLARAGLGLVRTGLAGLPSPLGVADVDVAARLARRYGALPADARSSAAEALLADAFGRGAKAIGAASPAQAQASLRLLDLTAALGPQAAAQVAEARRSLRQQRIGALAADWPVDALALAADASDDAQTRALAQPILLDLAHAPSLLLDAQPDVETLLKADAGNAALAPVRAALQAALAWRDDPLRKKALEDGDRDSLRKRVAAHPDDQEAVLALAGNDAGHGNADGALQRLRAIGKPGRTTGEAQRALAELLISRDQLSEAAAILEPHVAARLPRFNRAVQAYSEAARKRSSELYDQLNHSSELPEEIRNAGDDKAKQQEAADTWVAERLAGDQHLGELKAAAQHQAQVVPAVLALGRLKLQQARAAAAAQRGELLAEAERLFLAIREEADDQPGYHLDLGQVYHRLGRAAEGDAELSKLLGGSVQQKLAVANVYRDLGLIPKAIAILEKVYDEGDLKTKHDAAEMRALMTVGLDEKEKWLRRADTQSEEVALELRELLATRAYDDGRDQEAARIFGEVGARREKLAAHNSVAANNAAVTYERRFAATGDPKDFEHALRLLESAYRAEPNSALVAENLANVLAAFGVIKVVGRFAPVSSLRPTSEQAAALVDALLAGSQREQVRAALRAEPMLQRAMQILRQAEVLAPQKVDIYEKELELADRGDDAHALAELEARLQGQTSLDTGFSEQTFQRYVAGEFDAERKQAIDADEARLAKRLADAHQRHDARAEGFARYLHAGMLSVRAEDSGRVEDAAAAQRETEAVQALAPELSPLDGAWSLVGVALAKAAQADASFAKWWQPARRRYGMEPLLLALRSGDGGAARLALLRKQPEVAAAARLAREEKTHPPRLHALVLARVMGDDALAAHEAAALADPTVLPAERIRLRLHPERPGAGLLVQFIQGGGK